MSTGTLRVLYAFLQGDKHKCLAAINSVRNTFTEALGGVMDTNSTRVMSIDNRTSEWTSRDYIGLNQSSENARQLAANLKIKMDNLTWSKPPAASADLPKHCRLYPLTRPK